METKVLYPKIKAKMAYHGETRKDIAKLLELSLSAVNNRFDGKVDWLFREITTLKKHWNCDYEDLV